MVDRTLWIKSLQVGDETFSIASIEAAAQVFNLPSLNRLCVAHRILLENLLRHYDETLVTARHIRAMAKIGLGQTVVEAMPFYPARC